VVFAGGALLIFKMIKIFIIMIKGLFERDLLILINQEIWTLRVSDKVIKEIM